MAVRSELVGPRARLNRLLVLRLLVARPEATMRQIASELAVTPQAVSSHVRALERGGFVRASNGKRAATPRGVQSLQEGLREFKSVIDAAVQSLAVVNLTSAVARNRIRAGDRVGLFMENGVLVARAHVKSASAGNALEPAEPGDECLVTGLEGVVDLQPARLRVVRVPGPEEGGTRRLQLGRVRAQLEAPGREPRRVGCVGTGARVLVEKLGWKPELEFAPVRAAFHACELGVPALLFVTSDRLRDALAELDALNSGTLARVPIELLDLAPRPR